MKREINQSIIEKFQHGDPKAFRAIFNVLYAIMFSFARKYLNDSIEAEDMVQEAFIELWNQKEKFQNPDQLKSFLYITVRNKCLNRIKHLQVRVEYAQSCEGETHDALNFEEEVIKTEFLAQLKMVIDNLPVKRKKIILLSMHGCKNQEIAEELNISINTVKLQKKIAYQELRRGLSSSLPILILFTSFFS